MREKSAGWKSKPASRQVLGLAVAALGAGGALLLASLALGVFAQPALQALSKGLRWPVPYALVLGAGLLVVHAAIRPRPGRSSPPRLEPAYFGGDTTSFAAQLDSRGPEPGTAEPGPHRGEQAPAAGWSARVFLDIEWRRFEAVCAALFAQEGLEARTRTHGEEGGADIWLHPEPAGGPVAVVRCRHSPGQPVSVKQVREFLGVMAAHKLPRGTFATAGTFTPDARQFARENGITPVDGLGLLAIISQRTHKQQQALLKIAYEGEYWRPSCARCGLKMVEHSARKKQNAFWGCPDYPRCRFTLPLQA